MPRFEPLARGSLPRYEDTFRMVEAALGVLPEGGDVGPLPRVFGVRDPAGRGEAGQQPVQQRRPYEYGSGWTTANVRASELGSSVEHELQRTLRM